MFKRSGLTGSCSSGAAALVAGLCLIAFAAQPAEAWHRRYHRSYAYHHHHRHLHFGFHLRHMRPGRAQTSQFAALVVDGNTGRILYARDETALRHPASITKVMTLYLLFEALDKGRLHLDSEIPISAHAASMAPTKLGLHPGQTIRVEDAIKAVVTLSANDVAVAIAEKLGGSEDHFCEMMTRKAHELGMGETRYVNASGLPDDEQITTAHDLSLLGRAIEDRFPRYYRYFSTRNFSYRGIAYRNHNHLLGRVEGMDGIKTGYTRSSGFNLLTSVRRDGHYIIAVVLGGASSSSRDRIMDDLIEAHIDDGSAHRVATAIAEKATDEDDDDDTQAQSRPAQQNETATQPLNAADVAKPTALSGAGNVPMPIERPRPAFISAAPKPEPLDDEDASADWARTKHVAFDGTTARANASTATPSSLGWIVGAQPARAHEGDARYFDKTGKADAQHTAPDSTGALADAEAPADMPSGWMIQIGATDDAAKANELIQRAKAENPAALSKAKSFTEKVQKGSETLYRARFAGLEADAAEAACKSLKRAGFACFAIRN
jgi:D-alanyl-D-alanine carboxypeptidase